MAINRVVLVGRLVKDPELKKTAGDVSVCRFTLAVDRNISRKNAALETQTADFPSITVWRAGADFLCKYAKKGSKVSVDGRLQTYQYQKDGKTIYGMDVLADHVGLEDRPAGNGGAQQPSAPSEAGGYEASDGDNPLDISDDDLPF